MNLPGTGAPACAAPRMGDAAREVQARGARASHVPGEAELWILILGDMIVFGLFFAIWGWNHATQPELFAWGGAQMNRALGLANTLVLITSSAAVASGLNLARLGRSHEARLSYAAAAALGCTFVVLKAIEYGQHIAAGADALGNSYFMYYFVFTGIHLLHVVVGITALLFVMQGCRRLQPGAPPAEGDVVFLESVGVFWHLVDLLWIVLFFLIYLVR
ncbi:MAG TPA: cytochrome c oxidase subunit 3 [Solimonas sp.]|nr:cytochrome c oxidase subunit 3 [Solimonas sp.]